MKEKGRKKLKQFTAEPVKRAKNKRGAKKRTEK
jgi:hypothetical protein